MNLRLYLALWLFCVFEIVSSDFIDGDIWSDPELNDYETCKAAFGASISSDALQKEMKDVKGIEEPDGHRSVVFSKQSLWPGGKVIYKLKTGFSKEEKKKLACAMLFFSEKTCITFNRRKSTDRNYITFMKFDTGCYSSTLGMAGGEQEINLEVDGCWSHGTIIHEMMHAIGFFHEQARNDRDTYIQVHWGNIPSSWHTQYQTGFHRGIDQRLVGTYDYGSMMHYGRMWDSEPAMSALQTPVAANNNAMGNRDGPSPMDICKIKQVYGCESDIKEKCDALWAEKYTAHALNSCLVLHQVSQTYAEATDACTDLPTVIWCI